LPEARPAPRPARVAVALTSCGRPAAVPDCWTGTFGDGACCPDSLDHNPSNPDRTETADGSRISAAPAGGADAATGSPIAISITTARITVARRV
jgi:hypothetical protein